MFFQNYRSKVLDIICQKSKGSHQETINCVWKEKQKTLKIVEICNALRELK